MLRRFVLHLSSNRILGVFAFVGWLPTIVHGSSHCLQVYTAVSPTPGGPPGTLGLHNASVAPELAAIVNAKQ